MTINEFLINITLDTEEDVAKKLIVEASNCLNARTTTLNTDELSIQHIIMVSSPVAELLSSHSPYI